MPLIKKLIRLDEALDLIRRHISPVDRILEVHIRAALGMILAEDIIADKDIPPFDRAAMDGFAVRYEDLIGASLENPVSLRIIGESDIGSPFEGKLEKGTAVYVHTGSKIPDGANAVVPIEFVDIVGDRIFVHRSVSRGENIAFRGEDIRAGTILLRKGTLLEPQDISLIKSLGIKSVKVYDRPRIRVVAIGNELVDDPSKLVPGKILEYSREIPIGYLRKWGVAVEDVGIIPDDIETLKNIIESSLENFDALVTIGGTSVGRRDLVPKVLEDYGSLIFHGVAVEPSKPMTFGLIRSLPIIGLPGLPVATFISTITMLREAINSLRNSKQKIEFPEITATIARRVWSKPGIKTFVRVKLECRDGTVYAYPIMISGAGVLSSVTSADGIVIVPEELEGFESGEKVRVILLRTAKFC